MKIKEFEQVIKQEIDKDLEIRDLPNAPDISAVYWRGFAISVSLPPQEIYEEFRPDYKDTYSHIYRTISQAKELIEARLNTIKNDAEFIEIMSDESFNHK